VIHKGAHDPSPIPFVFIGQPKPRARLGELASQGSSDLLPIIRIAGQTPQPEQLKPSASYE
jgi:hypothetical protein